MMDGTVLDKIHLKNMKFYAYHGVMEEENIKGQVFVVDMTLFADFRKVGRSDNLEDTIDYSAVYQCVKEVVTTNRFKLIEKLAYVISEEVIRQFRMVQQIQVVVKKPQAPIAGEFDYMSVEVFARR